MGAERVWLEAKSICVRLSSCSFTPGRPKPSVHLMVNYWLSCEGPPPDQVVMAVSSSIIVNGETEHGYVSIREGEARVIGLMRKHYAACEEAVARLPRTDDENPNEKIRECIRGCRRVASGTGYWAYLNNRYFDLSQLNDKWGLTFTLDC